MHVFMGLKAATPWTKTPRPSLVLTFKSIINGSNLDRAIDDLCELMQIQSKPSVSK